MGTKVPLPAVLVLVLAAAALGWLLRPERRDEPVRETLLAAAPADPGSPAPTLVAAAPASERVPAPPAIEGASVRPSSRPAPADLAALEARLRELLASGSDDARAWEKTLRDLVAEGSPEAIGLVLEAMQDERCEFAHRGELFARLLGPVDDPRILPVARAVVDGNLAAGLDSSVDTRGYLELVARKGGADEGPYLAALLGHGGQVSAIAAENVAQLAGKTSPEPFLEALSTPSNDWYAQQLAESLAGWDDARVQARLAELAASAETPMQLREQVLKALARETEPAELSQFASWYRSAKDDAERSLALGALGHLGYATDADDAAVSAVATPLLTDALGNPSRATWIAAVYTIRDHEEFHVPSVRDGLAVLARSVAGEKDQELVRGTLARVERTLR